LNVVHIATDNLGRFPKRNRTGAAQGSEYFPSLPGQDRFHQFLRSQTETIADLKTELKFGVVQETAQFSFVTR
jgi:hypothetical protein